jgi:hypothetical protein
MWLKGPGKNHQFVMVHVGKSWINLFNGKNAMKTYENVVFD